MQVMWLDILLLVLAIVLCITGIVGSIVPGLPGPPVSFVGVLLMAFCPGLEFSYIQAIILFLSFFLAVVVTILDTMAPVWFTKMTGGTKAGTWGATIGLVIGLIAGFFGFWFAPFLGPFLGAFLGELFAGTSLTKAFEIACYSFASFIITTGMKLIYCVVVLGIVLCDAVVILVNYL